MGFFDFFTAGQPYVSPVSGLVRYGGRALIVGPGQLGAAVPWADLSTQQ